MPWDRDAEHHCHWPGCTIVVPPKFWGCRDHWFKLPKHIRDRILATYRPGQEITKTPSREYLAAARMAHQWIIENHDKAYVAFTLRGLEE